MSYLKSRLRNCEKSIQSINREKQDFLGFESIQHFYNVLDTDLEFRDDWEEWLKRQEMTQQEFDEYVQWSERSMRMTVVGPPGYVSDYKYRSTEPDTTKTLSERMSQHFKNNGVDRFEPHDFPVK